MIKRLEFTEGMIMITKQRYYLISRNLLFLLKSGIGTAIAIILADSFGLAFSASAGIITLLTIQNTKKETIFIALKRVLGFVLAVVVAYGIFGVLGYTSIAFGVFALIFIALCKATGLQDGISMNTVLTTHFLVEQRMDLSMILNEIGLLLIGMGIGIIINLIMPKNKKQIQREQRAFEQEMKIVLRSLAKDLKEKAACLVQGDDQLALELEHEVQGVTVQKQASTDFTRLEEEVESLLQKAKENEGNTLLSDTRYLISYFEMRKMQIDVLKTIRDHINQIPVVLEQTYPIADYLNHVADTFHELNNVKGLLEEMEQLYDYYRKQPLPETREEFEYRAILFQILKELEYFLRIKRIFVLELESKNMKSYWKKES